MRDPAAGESVADEFLDIVCSDEELLAAEFEAIIAANWPAPPEAVSASSAASLRRRGRAPSRTAGSRHPGGNGADAVPARPHERSPPAGRAVE